MQELVTLQATRNADGLATEGQITHPLTLLSSADGLRLVGCGDGVLSIHVLALYPGWAVFIEQATAAVQAVKPLVGAAPVHQIAVRYVDRIVLPATKGVSYCRARFRRSPSHFQAHCGPCSRALRQQD